MKIIYFHQHFSTPRGKTSIRSYEMSQRLLSQGHQVTMVCGSYGSGSTDLNAPFVGGKRRGIVDGIDVIEFDLAYDNKDGFVKRGFTFLKFATGSVSCALREPYDVAFATSTPLTAGIPGIFARWIRRKTFVFEVRDLWPELPREMGVITNPIVLWMLSVLEWCAYQSAHRCVALSPGIANGIARRGISRENIAMVPNGCDFGVFGDEGGTAGIRPDGVASEDLMAIFTGTHGQANGLNAVLEAAKVLKTRKREDIKLVLIGDGKLKPQLKQDAATQGLDNVIFHDRVAKAELASLMAGADIGMQCLANVPAFYFGTSPNKFFDYISCGLPVLNNYPGWLAELITDNECGFAVPPDDPEAFADALEAATDDRENLLGMGVRARKLAETEFNRKSLSEKWVQWVTAAV